MKIIYILLFLLLSCGKDKSTTIPATPIPNIPNNNTMNTTFKVYYDAFIALASTNNYILSSTAVNIDFDSTLSNNILGYCQTQTGQTPKVRMNPTHWNSSSFANSRRALLMYHELGHCLLGLAHNDATITTSDGYNISKSIMNTYEVYYSVFQVNYTYYTSELFDSSYTSIVYYFGNNNFPTSMFASKTYTIDVNGNEGVSEYQW